MEAVWRYQNILLNPSNICMWLDLRSHDRVRSDGYSSMVRVLSARATVMASETSTASSAEMVRARVKVEVDLALR